MYDKMQQEILGLKYALVDMFNQYKDILAVIEKVGTNTIELKEVINQLNANINNVKYEICDPKKNVNFFYPQIVSCEETVNKIINERKSIARFGDGEFSIMENILRQTFQRLDDHLAVRLAEVVRSDDPRILIAIANNYGDLSMYNKLGADGIRGYMTEDTRQKHEKYLSSEKVYYDAYISRPYVLFADNLTDAPRKRFEHLKKIWKDRKVLVVEGSKTRMGVGNDLLDGAVQIERILAPATSSFDRYEEILKASLENAQKDTLFLIAMGPCAGVLAYDLTLEGYQALDIGHLDLEYEWFLVGEGKRVPIPNKYNNEFYGGDQVADIQDPSYEEQIIVRFDK